MSPPDESLKIPSIDEMLRRETVLLLFLEQLGCPACKAIGPKIYKCPDCDATGKAVRWYENMVVGRKNAK